MDAVGNGKPINKLNMENVKEVLMEFATFFNQQSDDYITDVHINLFLGNHLKLRPREPEADECNEQAKEVCEHPNKRDSYFVHGWMFCPDCQQMIHKQTD